MATSVGERKMSLINATRSAREGVFKKIEFSEKKGQFLDATKTKIGSFKREDSENKTYR